jgi:hypothetical protein
LDRGGKRSATPLSPRNQASSQSGVTAAALQNGFTAADADAFTRELEKLHPEKLQNSSADPSSVVPQCGTEGG